MRLAQIAPPEGWFDLLVGEVGIMPGFAMVSMALVIIALFRELKAERSGRIEDIKEAAADRAADREVMRAAIRAWEARQ